MTAILQRRSGGRGGRAPEELDDEQMLHLNGGAAEVDGYEKERGGKGNPKEPNRKGHIINRTGKSGPP